MSTTEDAFPTDYAYILEAIDAVDPVRYSHSRNFADGAVTRLSPYLSRGVISTRTVMESVLRRDLEWPKVEKLIQELAWRDYWQQVWCAKGDAIDEDLKHPQQDVSNHDLPTAIDTARTGIDAVDTAIDELYRTGYMHNHMRMYVAAIACNQACSHWRSPARWMYYHLLDGDWASNALSWQWVAGANANKKYIANQENINRFFYSAQRGTFLDTDYETLAELPTPEVLKELCSPGYTTTLPQRHRPELDNRRPTLIYNYYNLDPTWRKDEDVNRILLLEPSVFERYPVADRNIEFVLRLSDNIPGIQVVTAEFDELMTWTQDSELVYKEHPLNRHYRGTVDEREWMSDVTGYFPSFFAFWKRCKKRIG